MSTFNALANPSFEKSKIEIKTRLKKILHPTDFSENAAAAFFYCLMLARQFNAKVDVLNITESPTLLNGPSNILSMQEMEEKKIDDVMRKMSRYCAQHTNDINSIEITTHIRIGNFAPKLILSFADAAEADIIVLGAKGQSAAKEMVVGSTVHKVIAESHHPVLTVPLL